MPYLMRFSSFHDSIRFQVWTSIKQTFKLALRAVAYYTFSALKRTLSVPVIYIHI